MAANLLTATSRGPSAMVCGTVTSFRDGDLVRTAVTVLCSREWTSTDLRGLSLDRWPSHSQRCGKHSQPLYRFVECRWRHQRKVVATVGSGRWWKSHVEGDVNITNHSRRTFTTTVTVKERLSRRRRPVVTRVAVRKARQEGELTSGFAPSERATGRRCSFFGRPCESLTSTGLLSNFVGRRKRGDLLPRTTTTTTFPGENPSSLFAARQIVSLFGGFFAGKKRSSDSDSVDDTCQNAARYHDDVVPPFPPSLLNDTFLAGRELKCCYKASLDGFGSAEFHARCDFRGPSVVVLETEDGSLVGGFNPEGFRSTDDYYDSFDAFLFYWPEGSENGRRDEIIKLAKVGGSGAAIFDYARGGPQFGADGLIVGPPLAPVMGGFSGPDTNSGLGNLRESRSRLGLSYAKRPDGKDSLFGDERTAVAKEVEVFCCPQISALYSR